ARKRREPGRGVVLRGGLYRAAGVHEARRVGWRGRAGRAIIRQPSRGPCLARKRVPRAGSIQGGSDGERCVLRAGSSELYPRGRKAM
ncbi:MAG: tRNA (Guanine37-N1) -methyltransferase, partial [uncultured Rubrobacteraceae bacterium]